MEFGELKKYDEAGELYSKGHWNGVERLYYSCLVELREHKMSDDMTVWEFLDVLSDARDKIQKESVTFGQGLPEEAWEEFLQKHYGHGPE